MTSATFELLGRAIQERKQVICSYQGRIREICPHVLGFKDGQEKVLAYQFAGRSRKGLPPNGAWRCFEIWQIKDATLRDGPWRTKPHSKPQTCVDQIAVEVAD